MNCIPLIEAFYLADWGEETTQSQLESGEGLSDRRNTLYLNWYAVLLLMGILVQVMRGLFFAEHRMGASLKLHTDLLRSVLSAPIAFFDTTPLGRILNRFSSDMLVIDENLSQTWNQILNSYFQCIGALAAVAGSTKGTFVALLVPLTAVYVRLENYFRCLRLKAIIFIFVQQVSDDVM